MYSSLCKLQNRNVPKLFEYYYTLCFNKFKRSCKTELYVAESLHKTILPLNSKIYGWNFLKRRKQRVKLLRTTSETQERNWRTCFLRLNMRNNRCHSTLFSVNSDIMCGVFLKFLTRDEYTCCRPIQIFDIENYYTHTKYI